MILISNAMSILNKPYTVHNIDRTSHDCRIAHVKDGLEVSPFLFEELVAIATALGPSLSEHDMSFALIILLPHLWILPPN